MRLFLQYVLESGNRKWCSYIKWRCIVHVSVMRSITAALISSTFCLTLFCTSPQTHGLSSRVIFSSAVLLHTGTVEWEPLNGSLFQMSNPVPGFNTQIKFKQTGRPIKCHNPPKQMHSTALTLLMKIRRSHLTLTNH